MTLLPVSWRLACAGLPLMLLASCHSAFVQTTITNLGPPIRVFEMDYPSQSFGTEELGTNQVFHYRFKVQGSGAVKLQFNDAAGKVHNATGPVLDEKSEGALAVVIGADERVAWTPDLRVAK